MNERIVDLISRFSALLGRSNSYNGLQSRQGQPRVISGKQNNGSAVSYSVRFDRFLSLSFFCFLLLEIEFEC